MAVTGTDSKNQNMRVLVKELRVDGKQIAAAQALKITDASTAHALNATFSDTEVEAALDALGTKINAIIDALEGAGISAST